MKPPSTVRLLSMIGVAALLLMGRASAADGARDDLGRLLWGLFPSSARPSSAQAAIILVTTRGPSMGDSPEAIPARLARGEAADVVILDGGAADELARRDLVRADSKIELRAFADRHGGARRRR